MIKQYRYTSVDDTSPFMRTFSSMEEVKKFVAEVHIKNADKDSFSAVQLISYNPGATHTLYSIKVKRIGDDKAVNAGTLDIVTFDASNSVN